MASSVNTAHGPITGPSASRQMIVTGNQRSIIASASVTDILKTTAGFLHNLVISTVGTGWQLDFYDDPATTNNLVYTWVTADGKGPFALQIPLNAGLVVVSNGGTPGKVTAVWS